MECGIQEAVNHIQRFPDAKIATLAKQFDWEFTLVVHIYECLRIGRCGLLHFALCGPSCAVTRAFASQQYKPSASRSPGRQTKTAHEGSCRPVVTSQGGHQTGLCRLSLQTLQAAHEDHSTTQTWEHNRVGAFLISTVICQTTSRVLRCLAGTTVSAIIKKAKDLRAF